MTVSQLHAREARRYWRYPTLNVVVLGLCLGSDYGSAGCHAELLSIHSLILSIEKKPRICLSNCGLSYDIKRLAVWRDDSCETRPVQPCSLWLQKSQTIDGGAIGTSETLEESSGFGATTRGAGWKCDSRVENDVLCVVFPRHRYGLEAVVGMIAARLLDGGGGY